MIGKLNKRVSIMKQSDEPDDFGGVNEVYSIVSKVWAKITHTSASHYQNSVQIGETLTHYIEIRHFKGLTDDYVIEYLSSRYKILRVRNKDDRKRRMLLECVEITNG